MMRIFTALAAACCLILSACAQDATPELDAAARNVIAQTRAGDTAALREGAVPEIHDAREEVLVHLTQLMPEAEPDSANRIGYLSQTNWPEGPNTHSLTYEYNWPDRAALVGVSFHQSSSAAPLQLHGLSVRMATREELAALDLNFFSKTFGHYAMLLALAGSLALMIVAFVASIRTPGLKRRWLWCIGSLVTIFVFTMDWSTGAVVMRPLNVGLVSAGMTRAASQFAPWFVSTGFPLGAIIVLLKLRKRRARPPADAATETPAETPA